MELLGATAVDTHDCPPVTEDSERALIDRARTEPRAFDSLYRRYYRMPGGQAAIIELQVEKEQGQKHIEATVECPAGAGETTTTIQAGAPQNAPAQKSPEPSPQ